MTKETKAGKGRKAGKVIGILALILVILAAAVIFLLTRASRSMNAEARPVEDYDTRIVIWENAAGNSGESKLPDMNIQQRSNPFLSMLSFVTAIVDKEYRDVERKVDTFTYDYEIKGGYESETYSDTPYLIPYLSEGSDRAVIVIPGGGFGYKSMDGDTGESRDVAVTLQQRGIHAFVLHYRTNPYEYPVPYLDLQRAVRYLRYHASEYGIDPGKIGLIGYSAGGNVIGTFINTVQGQEMFPEGYGKDEIDETDDSVSSAAMIYPALSFRYNVPMLFCLFDDEQVRDEGRRDELLQLTDLWRHLTSQSVPQFISYGTKDGMVGMDETLNYIQKATEAGCSVKTVEAEGADHGFGQEYYMDEYLTWLSSLWG